MARVGRGGGSRRRLFLFPTVHPSDLPRGLWRVGRSVALAHRLPETGQLRQRLLRRCARAAAASTRRPCPCARCRPSNARRRRGPARAASSMASRISVMCERACGTPAIADRHAPVLDARARQERFVGTEFVVFGQVDERRDARLGETPRFFAVAPASSAAPGYSPARKRPGTTQYVFGSGRGGSAGAGFMAGAGGSASADYADFRGLWKETSAAEGKAGRFPSAK